MQHSLTVARCSCILWTFGEAAQGGGVVMRGWWWCGGGGVRYGTILTRERRATKSKRKEGSRRTDPGAGRQRQDTGVGAFTSGAAAASGGWGLWCGRRWWWRWWRWWWGRQEEGRRTRVASAACGWMGGPKLQGGAMRDAQLRLWKGIRQDKSIKGQALSWLQQCLPLWLHSPFSSF